MKPLALLLLTCSFILGASINEADSLRSELEQITSKLESIERIELEKRKAELEAELARRKALEPNKDTVVIVDTVYIEKSDSKAQEAIKNLNSRLKKGNSNGIGGCGGPAFGVGAFSLTPVKDMIAADISLRGNSSPFYGIGMDQSIKGSYETFFVSGGMGLAGLGNGVRIGGGGYGADRTYRSKIVGSDPIHEMKVSIGYGGVILEKAWDKEKVTISAGTLIGAGGLTVNLQSEANGFADIYAITAPFFASDIHSTLSISFTSWMHVGVSAYTVLFASSNGFNLNEGFVTPNGGAAFRIMFGNLR